MNLQVKQPNLLRGPVPKCSLKEFHQTSINKEFSCLNYIFFFLYYSVAHFYTISSSSAGFLQNLMQYSQNWSHNYIQDKANSHPPAYMMHKLFLLLT